ncbi:MAG TPA: hypothetical protein VND93_23940 [Myxococcales bacterium]|jgi:hypothetical protein|nr:hypothetical protein [Myxococcales bacterium]
MQFQPVDLSELFGITLAMLTVLIPVAGWTLRFALKPVVEAMMLARGRGASRDEIAVLEKRIALLERELELRRLPAAVASPDVVEAPAGGQVASLRSLDRA